MTIRSARSLLLMLIDVIWGYAAAAIFVRIFSTERAGPSLIAVAAVVLLAAAVAHIMSSDVGSEMPIAGTAASVVALFAIAHTEYAAATPPWDPGWANALFTHGRHLSDAERGAVAGVTALTALWVRGVGGAHRGDEPGAALRSVLFGLAAVGLAAVVSPPARGPDIFGALALAYVPLALVVLTLYQTADPERPLRTTLAQSGRWLAALIAATFVVAVLAAAIDPRSLGALAPVGKPLLFALGLVGRFLLVPVFGLVAAIVHLFPSLPHHELPPQPVMQPPPGPPQVSGTPGWQVIAGRVLAGVGVALVVGCVLALIWLAFRRRTPKKREAREQRERVEDAQSLGDDIGDLLGGLLRRFRRPSRAWTSPVAMRRLYHDMLAGAAADGVERQPAATPLQFAPRLDAHYASSAPSAISGAFARSRYGRVDFDDATVADLRRRWEALRSARTP